MIDYCPAFFRLHDGKPVCGNNYCPYVRSEEYTCPIRPSRFSPKVWRAETSFWHYCQRHQDV